MKSISFAKEKLKHGSSYRLVEWNQLNIAEQEMLSGLYDEAEVYGIFQPSISTTNLTHKVAYKEVALLYLHLQHSNSLPRYFFSSDEKKINEAIAQLVLDGIIEMECEGDFVSGHAAVKAIYGETLLETATIPDRLSALSIQGIRYAYFLRGIGMRSLSQRLYTFNTMPWDACARSKFYADHSVNGFLFSSADKKVKNLLDEHWKQIHSSEENYWLSWWKATGKKNYSISIDKPTFKLYISPMISDLPKVLSRAIPVLSSSAAFSFKIGAFIQGLLRPDKIVAYFQSIEDLMQAASMLKKELGECDAQGVPFTAQIDEAGMLSWGVDPAESDVLSTIEAGSWRLKVTDQLALAIIQAQTDELDLQEAIPFIRAKLFSVGINTADWTSANHQ